MLGKGNTMQAEFDRTDDAFLGIRVGIATVFRMDMEINLTLHNDSFGADGRPLTLPA
jgi:hypothetical protein